MPAALSASDMAADGSNEVRLNEAQIRQPFPAVSGLALKPPQGPTAASPPEASGVLGETQVQPEDHYAATASGPSSPYTRARQLVHSLTLPPLPNVSIPPSPPGSPSPAAFAKVSRFLDLKAQDIHFNAKLASSSQLRNPSLLQNLTQFAGIDMDAGQYASTLVDGCGALPVDGFPEWAYTERLNKAQADVGRRREEKKKQRDAVDFVPSAATSRSASASASGTPSGQTGRPMRAAERIMSGLSHNRERDKDGDNRRRSRFDDRRRSRSRSPKRRRDL